PSPTRLRISQFPTFSIPLTFPPSLHFFSQTHTHTNTHTHTQTHTHTHTHTNLHTHNHTHRHKYTHRHIITRTQTQTHTHTQTLFTFSFFSSIVNCKYQMFSTFYDIKAMTNWMKRDVPCETESSLPFFTILQHK